MEKLQNFNKGLDSDHSPVSQPEGTYVDALNMEIISDEMQGSFAISNSKGNKFQISIPNMAAITKVTYVSNGSTTITIQGVTAPARTFNNIEEVYDYILANSAIYTGLNVQYTISYNNTELIITPKPGFTAVTTTGSVDLVASQLLPAVTGLQIIGYGIIRDSIYLFTTNCTDIDPETTGLGYGYIWKLTYNNITFDAVDATLTLVYANNLNFSTYWNIPQTGVVGRYESDLTSRLYWTDNYNKLRSLNVADPQLAALNVTLVDVQPSVDFDIALLTDIRSSSGSSPLKIGCYQLAYRLSNNGGSSTIFSLPSNPVYVVTGGTNGAEENQAYGLHWADYHGDVEGTTTTKRITWTINNVDRDFNRIEAVILVRESKNDVPTIYSVYNGNVLDDTISIDVDGDAINASTTVTIDEFLALSKTFNYCKTIGTKDNRLVVGNVRNQVSDINFDARAYRHNSLGNFSLINNKVSGAITPYIGIPSSYLGIPETSDAINQFNLDSADPLYSSAFKYKSDGVTLGGTGTYISYEFMQIAIAMDKTVEPVSPQPLPIVSTNQDSMTNVLDLNVYTTNKYNTDVLQEYPLVFPNPINNGMKFPQANSIYWGYQHNEIYRFGIQFFDKNRNPYFVKWIGDIRMPDYFDPCPAANSIFQDGSPTGDTTFKKSVIGTYGINDAYAYQLGIKFNVRVPAALTNDVSGYSIVRVKREETDKTVVAEGIITNGFIDDPASDDFFLGSGNMNYQDPNVDMTRINFSTPNMLDASLALPTAGMSIKSKSFYNISNTVTNEIDIQGGIATIPGQSNTVIKLYDHQPLILAEQLNLPLTASQLMTFNGSIGVTGGTGLIRNYVDSTQIANGNACYYMQVGTALPAISTALVPFQGYAKFFVYIYNNILNQYGGNTYNVRSNNEYIMCSHFRGIKTKSADYTDSPIVFGGDVTNDIMDDQRVAPNWNAYDCQPANPTYGEYHKSTAFFYPASSPVNRALRHGRHYNTSAYGNDGSPLPCPIPSGDVDPDPDKTDYFYNTAYSCQNDIIKFFPKPEYFNEITTFDNRFYISDVKINNEITDSWSKFKAFNYWDVEGIYGPINSMLILSDKMYFWQDKAFGIIEISPRTLINDAGASVNSQIQTGTGLPLERHDYLSTLIGSKHQGSTISSSGKLFWFDANTKKIYYFSTGQGIAPISDVKGLYSFLGKNLSGEIQQIDKPTYLDSQLGINGVVATYDNKRNKAIFTFHSGYWNDVEEETVQKSFTVVLNERLGVFTTFHSFTPRVYINDYKQFFSTDNTVAANLNKIYIHDLGNYGEYYGVLYDSYIKYIANPGPQVTKIFDNIVYDSQSVIYDTATNSYINMNDDTWKQIRVTNDYQNTDIQNLVLGTNIDRKERSWKLAIPRNRVLYTSSNSPNIYTDLSLVDKDFGERMRDKYIQVELWNDNSVNSELRTSNLTTIFRQSAR